MMWWPDVNALKCLKCPRAPAALLKRLCLLVCFGLPGSPFTTAADTAAELESLPEEPSITASDRAHWAFRPLQASPVPAVRDSGWSRTAVDRFILAEFERRNLHPAPEADRRTLIRRVTFDLTGLPPSPESIERFVGDPAPDAYQRVVDELLSSPAYGERWAMFWLDLARFAETDGFEHDLVRPEAWRYRDWVIGALNEDLPYDRFVTLQLAADEVAPDDPRARLATGYLLAGPDMPDLNSQDERRHVFLNSMTANVGEVLLGLQYGCCQCHDHKADPLSQRDFYRLRAFFDPLDLFRAQKLTDTSDDPQIVGQGARVVQASVMNTTSSRVWVRGDYRRPGPEVAAAFPRVVVPDSVGEPVGSDAASRARLADWITSADNPLASRVIVNRIWQHHFGVGLAATPSDFGLMGIPPTHPELLDWLALELIRQQWSLKALHRLLVTSAVYRAASRPPDGIAGDAPADNWQTLIAADPSNRWYGRMRRRRLEGESIRDAMLAVSGQLNQEAGGPGVRPPLPPDVVRTLLKNQWPVSSDATQFTRRSIYLFVRRNLKYPLFDVFDRPDQNLSCARRTQTTIAPQALALLNSEFSAECADRIADHIAALGTDDARISTAWRQIIGRAPSASEAERAREFVASGGESVWRDLCLGLLNTSEFLYID